MSKLVDGKGICYDVSEPGTFVPMVSISNIPTGAKFYVKPNSTVASSPLASNDDEEGTLLRRVATLEDFPGKVEKIPKRSSFFGQMYALFQADRQYTTEMKNMGEDSYIFYEALTDNQEILLRSSFPGTIMCWNASPLRDAENFVDFGDTFKKSIFESTEYKRPHGPFCAVKGSFLAASIDVKTSLYHQSVDSQRDSLVKLLSMTDNTFQHFSGNGYALLMSYGSISEVMLHPGEQFDVFPGYLLGFTEGVTLEMESAGDAIIRNLELKHDVIRLTAPKNGGYVYTQSFNPTEFSEWLNKQ